MFGEPDHTGAGLTFHTRFFVFGHTYTDGRMTWDRKTSASRIGSDLAFLAGSLPTYWLEMPLGQSPLRFIAMRRIRFRGRLRADSR